MKMNILTYNDIHSIPTSRMVSNGIIINDKTVAVMRRIEESLSRLQPMGDDNVRYLWFRVAPGKPEDWGDYEEMKACGDVEDYEDYLKLWKEYVNEDTLWYRISVGYNRENETCTILKRNEQIFSFFHFLFSLALSTA